MTSHLQLWYLYQVMSKSYQLYIWRTKKKQSQIYLYYLEGQNKNMVIQQDWSLCQILH